MSATRLRLAVGVLALVAVFSVAGEWYFGVLSVGRLRETFPDPSLRKPAAAPLAVTVQTTPTHVTVRNGSSRMAELEALRSRRRRLRDRSAPKEGVRQRRLNDNIPVASIAEPGVFTNPEEIGNILARIDTCLMSVNMSAYFRSEGLYERAQTNARDLLSSLRHVVPNFETPYTVPCWDVRFFAKCEGPLVKGHIGDFNFTLKGRSARSKQLGVQWYRARNKMYVKQSSACLPKIFLLGYPKCGSTFLYCLLHRVLKYSLGTSGRCEATKEPHWWIVPGPREKAQSIEPDSIALYLLNFQRAAAFMESNTPAVTIDASPNLMFQWPRYSESESLENYCLLPSLIPIVLPDSKYFVIMRNPVSMLYSAFWFSCTMLGQKLGPVKFRGPDIFHERITGKIHMFNECKNEGKPLDLCVDVVAPNLYGPELPNCGRTRLEMGLYYFHARRWLSVVPRSRIHFFTLEEVGTGDLRATVDVITDFLELPRATADLDLDTDLQCNENSQHVIDYKSDPRLKMREDTKQILVKFFQPYNQMLAELLGDDKFLWNSHA
jgi:hypothetical protein